MIDVHVLVMDYTPREWVEQCRDSIDVAIERAGFPVFAHFIPGIPGHIGKARAAGYSLGSQPYATYVDDDDYMLPDGFRVLKAALESGAPAIYGRELQLQNGHLRPHSGRHNLMVTRRDRLIDCAAWKGCPDIVQRKTEGIDVLEPGYVYRVREGSKGRALARACSDEYRRAHEWQT